MKSKRLAERKARWGWWGGGGGGVRRSEEQKVVDVFVGARFLQTGVDCGLLVCGYDRGEMRVENAGQEGVYEDMEIWREFSREKMVRRDRFETWGHVSGWKAIWEIARHTLIGQIGLVA